MGKKSYTRCKTNRTRPVLELLEPRRMLDGAIWYVEAVPDADPDDGSRDYPFDYIQQGVDHAADGDEVVLLPGPETYTGDGNRGIDLSGRSLTIRSDTDDYDPEDRAYWDIVAATVIECDGKKEDPHRAFIINDGATVTIEGLTIQGGYAAGAGGAITVEASTVVIRNNVIQDSLATKGGAIRIWKCSHATIEGNRILENHARSGDGGGILVDESLAYITANLFDHNGAKEGLGGAVYCYHASPLLKRNVFKNNYANDHGTQIASRAGSPTLINNVLYAGLDHPDVDPSLAQVHPQRRSAPLILNTVIWGPGPSMSNPSRVHLFYSDNRDGVLNGQQGNICEEPHFLDPADPLGPDGIWRTSDDGFRLLPTSPCIDSGHPSFQDADGTRSDMGAYGDALFPEEPTEIYVDGSNSDPSQPWNGTPENAFQYIWEGLLAASDGDSILVQPGTYHENLIFRSDKSNVSLIGADPVCNPDCASYLIDGGNLASVVEAWFADAYEVAGFTLQNGNGTSGGAFRLWRSNINLHHNVFRDCAANDDGGAVQVASASDVQIHHNQFVSNVATSRGGAIWFGGSCTGDITDNVISENRTTGGESDGGGLCLDGSPTVSRNVISNNRAVDNGGGIWCAPGTRATIDHNVIVENQAGRSGGGIYLKQANRTRLVNNTIVKNTARLGGGIGEWRSKFDVLNTILWDNQADVGPEMWLDGGSGSDLFVDYSNVQGGRLAVYVDSDANLDWGHNNIYSDPLFAPDPDDYHLQSTIGRWEPDDTGCGGTWVLDDQCSPAIDRGDNSEYPVDEEPEPNGGVINLGAYGGTDQASMSCIPEPPPLLKILAMDPPPESVLSCESRAEIKLWFNTIVHPESVVPERFGLVGSGGDGLFYDEGQGEDNDVLWSISGRPYYRGDVDDPVIVKIDDLPCGGLLPRDYYRFTARDELVNLAEQPLDGEYDPARFPTDGSGNGVAEGDFVVWFEVTQLPPLAYPGHASVVENTANNPLLLDGCDPDGDDILDSEIDVDGDGQPDDGPPWETQHGTLTDCGDADPLTYCYTPDVDYLGEDWFDFRLSDGNAPCAWSDWARFTIDVIPEECDLEPILPVIDPPTCVCPGDTIRLNWTDTNHGPGATVDKSPDWWDAVYLSGDASLDGDDKLLPPSPILIEIDGPLDPGGEVAVGPIEVTVPTDLEQDGTMYLIIQVDHFGEQRESNEENNVLAVPISICPFIRLTGPFCGFYVDNHDPFNVCWEDFAGEQSLFVYVAVDDDEDPDEHIGLLVDGQPEDPDGAGGDCTTASLASLDPPLEPGIYYLRAWLSDDGGQRVSCYSNSRCIEVFEEAQFIEDPLDDAVGPDGDDGNKYEIYSLEWGRNGDVLNFRFRTNYNPSIRGGDVYISTGEETWGLALTGRVPENAQEVTADDLYGGVEWDLGSVIHLPYRIRSWEQHISDHSFVRAIPDPPCLGAPFALVGWFNLAFLPGGLPALGWTMWCGNDWVTTPHVVQRDIFYNNSALDGRDRGADAQDHHAIAGDKTALPPGQTATFANYTSYSRGINGIMVDVAGLANPDELNIENLGHYFEFHVGNDEDPDSWPEGPIPTDVTVRESPDNVYAERVTITWDDYAIRNQWLQVTVLANAEYTGLNEPHVFYFGNAVGESGNSETDAEVNETDVLLARDNPRNFFDPATVTCQYDYNRDARVNATDMLIAQSNQTDELTALKLIHPQLAPGESPGAKYQGEASVVPTTNPQAPCSPTTRPEISATTMAWLYDYQQTSMRNRPSEKHNPAAEAVDKLLATYCR